MKKTFVAIALAFGLIASPAYADVDIYETPLPVTVHVNGSFLVSDVDAEIINGRTVLPLRSAAEALYADVSWNQEIRQATIKKGPDTLVFTLGQTSFLKNGKSVALDVPLQIKDGRILLPLRAFSEALNIDVNWNNEYRDVSIGTPMDFKPSYKGYSYKASAILQKYKPSADTSDAVIDTWKARKTSYGTTTDNFLLVHKNGQKYRVYRVMVNAPATPVETIDLASGTGTIAVGNSNKLTVKDDPKLLYSYGPGHGPAPATTYFYEVSPSTIIDKGFIDPFDGRIETGYSFGAMTRF